MLPVDPKETLTFPVPIPNEERKVTEVFIFILPYGVSKGFAKAFIKPFKSPQSKVKKTLS